METMSLCSTSPTNLSCEKRWATPLQKEAHELSARKRSTVMEETGIAFGLIVYLRLCLIRLKSVQRFTCRWTQISQSCHLIFVRLLYSPAVKHVVALVIRAIFTLNSELVNIIHELISSLAFTDCNFILDKSWKVNLRSKIESDLSDQVQQALAPLVETQKRKHQRQKNVQVDLSRFGFLSCSTQPLFSYQHPSSLCKSCSSVFRRRGKRASI